MIQAGELRWSIQIKRKSSTTDEFGSLIENWTGVTMTIKANVKNISGGENVNGKEIFNSSKMLFTTYYRDIKETDRIVFNSKEYNIISIVEIGLKQGLEITADLINS